MARVNLGETLKNILIAIVWFVILWFVAFPVAFFCAPWYIFLQPLEVLFRCKLNLWLLKGVNLPDYCTTEMLKPFGWDSAFDGYVQLPDP